MKSFTVTNPKTGKTVTIEGNSLKAAIKEAGLHPDKWVEVKHKEED